MYLRTDGSSLTISSEGEILLGGNSNTYTVGTLCFLFILVYSTQNHIHVIAQQYKFNKQTERD